MTENQPLTPVAAVITIFLCVLFGGNPVAVKISLAGFGHFTNVAIRFSMAAVVILIWAAATGQPLKIKPQLWTGVLTIGVILSIQMALFYFGMGKTCASHGALITNLMPFFVLILSHLFLNDDRITIKKILGMAVGFWGIVLILSENPKLSPDLQTGDLLLLLAVFMWACRVVVTKKIIKDFEPFHLVIYPFVFASVLFFMLALFLDGQMIICLNARVISALLYQSLVIASLGFVLWNCLLKKHGATALYSFGFITPVAGVFWGWLILQEPLTPRLLAAMVLVAAGLVIFHFKRPASRQIA